VQDVVHVPDRINSSVTKDGPNYPARTHHTPTPIFIMKREFVKKSWIIALQYRLRTYFSMYEKPALIREKYCELPSPSSTD
jgi:hypothetical protein